jgi:phage-related protein (TIGR01555 family)
MTKSIYTTDGLENVVAGLGTERDKRSYSNYGLVASLSWMELDAMYRGSWLAKRIVNSVAEDMTREWIDVSIKGDDDFDFCELEKPWKLKAKVTEALRWARLYGGAAIIVGTGFDELNTPLNIESLKQGQLKYLLVLDRWQLTWSGTVDEDIESQNFSFPSTYIHSASQKAIHWTRVIRFEGQPLPFQSWIQNSRWHDSELQHVIDSITSYDSTRDIVHTMLYEANVDVVKAVGMADLLASKDGEKKIIKRFQTAALMKSFNRTLLLDDSETYEKKSNNFTNLSDVWGRFIDDVCGAAEIPKARLFGDSPGGLNATGKGELINYYDMISNKQESQLLAQVEKLVHIIVVNELGNYPDDLQIRFNPLWQTSETEQIANSKVRADRDKIYLDSGIVTPAEVGQSLLDDNVYPAMTEESITLLEEMENEPLADPVNPLNPTLVTNPIIPLTTNNSEGR